MDVVLDASIFLQSLFGRGGDFLQTNQFVELFMYLRRTNSRFVIPMLTFYEVVERYRDRLNETMKAARDSWSDLQRVSISPLGHFNEPLVAHEINELRRRLRNPARGFRSTLYPDYGGVDVKEVVGRGIRRVRPASAKGEELRDVVL